MYMTKVTNQRNKAVNRKLNIQIHVQDIGMKYIFAKSKDHP